MNSHYLIAIAFLIGLGSGWLGKSWWGSFNQNHGIVVTSGTDDTVGNIDRKKVVTIYSRSETSSESVQQELMNSVVGNDLEGLPRLELPQSIEGATETSIISTFNTLVNDRRYAEAMALFQQLKRKSERSAASLKADILNELKLLTRLRHNSDFSELVESYLSIYYDDLDVLLLLAEFNQVNGSYLEVVNVFLLAKTYAYSLVDREKVDNRFKKFVIETDIALTGQKDWWSLINFYDHINASGLMTSTFQYQQAVAHLRSGDEAFAIAQFNQLLDDSLLGESARQALNSLTDTAEVPNIANIIPLEGESSIALQRVGNQYAVDLANSQQASVKLLIDTGASMTAVSRDSFNTLNADGDAVEQESRVFRTANGVIRGMVYSIPELILGPHRLENTQIAVIDFDTDRGIDGLLGMNILGQFRFHIDQDDSQLLLGKK